MVKFKDVGLYIFHGNGLCIYSHDSELDLDEQLVSGFMSAIFSFLEHMNNETPDFLEIQTKLNNTNYKYILFPEKDLFSMLIFKNVNSDISYKFIKEFTDSVVVYIKENYTPDELAFGDNLRDISEYANTELEVIRKKVYISYLKEILKTSIKYKVKEKLCSELLRKFDEYYVAQEIYNASLEPRSKTFNRIIHETNEKYYEIFHVLNLTDNLIKQE